MKKYSKFGVVIQPQTDTLINWKDLSKKEIVNNLKKCKFPTPLEMIKIISNLTPIAAKRKESEDYYKAKVKSFGGQLELGTTNGIPHYQLWIEVKPQILQTKMLQALSQAIYETERSNAIQVQALSTDSSGYMEYCNKEGKAGLTDEYSDMEINSEISDFLNYIEENSHVKKLLKHPTVIRSILCKK